MLHFRSTVTLTELFQCQLKRPFTCGAAVKAAPAVAACFSSGASSGRSTGKERTLTGWGAPQHIGRKTGVRNFCSKEDGQNEALKDSSTEK